MSATPFFPAAEIPTEAASVSVPIDSPHNADESMFRYLCSTLERSSTGAMEDWGTLLKLVGSLSPPSTATALGLAVQRMPLQADDGLTLALIAVCTFSLSCLLCS
jgi:hypothetical protein